MTSVADGTGSVVADLERFGPPGSPDFDLGDRHWRHEPLRTIGPHQIPDQEALVAVDRLLAAEQFAERQGLNRIVGGPRGRLGVVCAGKTYFDLVQALADLGVRLDQLEAHGLRILKLGMTYPLVTRTVVDFAASVDQVVVMEEKRPFVETQLRSILHEARSTVPVSGKRDLDGRPLVSPVGELDAQAVASVLARLEPDLAASRRPAPRRTSLSVLAVPPRPPAFCSGCPHNRSTVVPVGALVGGGVGCHGIMYFEARHQGMKSLPPTPMGAEGVPCIGLAPFVDEPHLFQNLGDGTLSHSGTLAIRASVAAGVNVTFKILYNSAVAMTGGQDVTGLMDVPSLTRALEAEGVSKIVVCAEDPGHYGRDARWARGVEVHGRDRLPEVQERLRQVAGVSVMVYDQRCAAEARRLRKRGLLEDPPRRVFINEAVCEGCGDCTVKSNCLSVVPVATEFGEKRRIHDASCNKDYTCLEGDCPSFVTVMPAQRKRRVRGRARRPGATAPVPPVAPPLPAGDLPAPAVPSVGGATRTASTSRASAGRAWSRRPGSWSGRPRRAASSSAGWTRPGSRRRRVRSCPTCAWRGSARPWPRPPWASPAPICTCRGTSCRPRPSATSTGWTRAGPWPWWTRPSHPRPGCSRPIRVGPTTAALERAITDRAGSERAVFVGSKRIAEGFFSNHLLANVVLVGAAFQCGGLPFSADAVRQAIGDRGSGAQDNWEAFEWGRWAVHDPDAVRAALEVAERGATTATAGLFEPSADAARQAGALVARHELPTELVATLERRVAQVVDYQDVALAETFLGLVGVVAASGRRRP